MTKRVAWIVMTAAACALVAYAAAAIAGVRSPFTAAASAERGVRRG